MLEFAIVAAFFSLFLVFCGDIVIKLSTQGKLDRLSFSAVSVLKERTQLFDADFTLTEAEADSLFTIIQNSLTRTIGSFEASQLGVRIEEQTYDDADLANALAVYNRGAQQCSVTETLGDIESNLAVITTWGRMSSLYRVTICYETDNWIGDLMDLDFTTVSSTSVMVGR